MQTWPEGSPKTFPVKTGRLFTSSPLAWLLFYVKYSLFFMRNKYEIYIVYKLSENDHCFLKYLVSAEKPQMSESVKKPENMNSEFLDIFFIITMNKK